MCALGPCPPWRGLRSGRPEASRPWLRLPHTYLRLYPRCPHPGASCWGGPLAEDAIRRLRRSPSLGPRSHFGHSDSVRSAFPLSPFPPLSLPDSQGPTVQEPFARSSLLLILLSLCRCFPGLPWGKGRRCRGQGPFPLSLFLRPSRLVNKGVTVSVPFGSSSEVASLTPGAQPSRHVTVYI